MLEVVTMGVMTVGSAQHSAFPDVHVFNSSLCIPVHCLPFRKILHFTTYCVFSTKVLTNAASLVSRSQPRCVPLSSRDCPCPSSAGPEASRIRIVYVSPTVNKAASSKSSVTSVFFFFSCQISAIMYGGQKNVHTNNV